MEQKQYINREGFELKVEVYYSIGGYSYFTYKNEPRGYFLSVQPVSVGRNEKGEIINEVTTMFSGVKTLLFETKRKSESSMQEALKMAETKQNELIEYVIEDLKSKHK